MYALQWKEVPVNGKINRTFNLSINQKSVNDKKIYCFFIAEGNAYKLYRQYTVELQNFPFYHLRESQFL